jgi:hypothetical protein
MIRPFFICALLVSVAAVTNGQMVSNSAIHNDPAKEQLCAQRARVTPVPFLIDQNYVDSTRALHPDTTFIAVDGINPQLIECRLSEETGKYEPASRTPEFSYTFWHLPRPQQFTPGIETVPGQHMAADACLKAARDKVNRPGFDHSVDAGVTEINLSVGPWYRPGAKIAGMKAERYDIAAGGSLFYKSSGPDLDAVRVSCLLSPTLQAKAIQTGDKTMSWANHPPIRTR